MYCKICHKQKPDNHYDLYPDHAVARKRPLYMGEEDEEEEAPARPRQSPRMASQRAPQSEEGEGEGSPAATWTLIGIGAAFIGFIGWAIWRGGQSGGA